MLNHKPYVQQRKFYFISHDINKKSSQYNFKKPIFNFKISKSKISSPGPRLWKKMLNNGTKSIAFSSLFFLKEL